MAEPMLGVFTINFPDQIKKSNERVRKRLEKYQKNQIFLPKELNIGDGKKDSKVFEIESMYHPKNIKDPFLSNIINIESSKKEKTIAKEDIYLQDGTINLENMIRVAEYTLHKNLRLMREKNIPDESVFKPLGFDGQVSRHKQNDIRKHYRHFLTTPLENVFGKNDENPFLDASTFDEFTIRRGKRFKDENASLLKSPTEYSEQKEVGTFKGWVSIMSKSNREMLNEKKLKSRSGQSLIEKVSLLLFI